MHISRALPFAISKLRKMSVTSSSQSTCPYQNFIESVQYALSQLNMSHLKLKEEQEKVVRAIFEGKDVFVLLPTSFGKSVCFQVLPFVFDYKLGLVGGQKKSAVVVVSPLIALMVDQVRSLRAHGVEAVIICSGAREGVWWTRNSWQLRTI